MNRCGKPDGQWSRDQSQRLDLGENVPKHGLTLRHRRGPRGHTQCVTEQGKPRQGWESSPRCLPRTAAVLGGGLPE